MSLLIEAAGIQWERLFSLRRFFQQRRHNGLGPVFLHEMTAMLDSNTGLLRNQLGKTLALRKRNPGVFSAPQN